MILTENAPEIVHLCKKDKRLSKLISMVGPLCYEIYEDPYDFVVHEIIEQMLSVKVGKVIYRRLVELCGGHLSPEAVQKLSEEEIRSIGTSKTKAACILAFTEEVLAGRIDFQKFPSMSDEEVFKTLTSVKGIGKWTANMVLLFVLDRKNILPTNDASFVQAYKWLYKKEKVTEKEIKEKCKKWSPYASVAARYLYIALDSGLTKEEFHLRK